MSKGRYTFAAEYMFQRQPGHGRLGDLRPLRAPGHRDGAPVGMNMLVLRPLLPEGSTAMVFGGVPPFMWAGVIRLAILIAFPIRSRWPPSMMK